MEKTVVIWDEVNAELRYFITAEDVADLNNKYINSVDDEKVEARMSGLVYTKSGKYRQKMLTTFPIQAVRDGAGVVVMGMLP